MPSREGRRNPEAPPASEQESRTGAQASRPGQQFGHREVIMKFLSWILRIVAAVILLQTLYFKFSGAEESVGLLFALAMTVFVCSLALVAIHRRDLPILGRGLAA
jgi:hypothetical protein